MLTILRLNDLSLDGQRRIAGRFIDGLMKAPRAVWHPALIVIDEAHKFALNAGENESSWAVKRLATAGRQARLRRAVCNAAFLADQQRRAQHVPEPHHRPTGTARAGDRRPGHSYG